MMSQFNRQGRSGRLLIATICAAASCGSNGYAADGQWNVNASGNWSDTTRWLNGIVADGAGDTATFNAVNLTTGTRTVTINTTPRTIGTFLIGDSNAGSNNRRSYVIAASGGATLTFDNLGSAAVITQRSSSNGDTFSTPIILNDSLNITNASGTQTLTFSTGGITAGTAGTKTITIQGTAAGDVTMSGVIGAGSGDIAIVKGNANNELTLSGANTFGGGVTVNAGTVNINNASAIGTGTLTIAGGAIGNTSGGGVTLSNDNVQSWDGNFRFGGTQSLNLGTGAVTLSGNRTITIASTNDTLTVGGPISGAGFSLSTANATAGVATGILGLSGANTYDGGTNINGGVVRFNNSGAIPATGMITIQSGGALSVSGAHTTLAAWMANPALSNTSTGALSLTGDSSEDFDPGAAGFNSVSLGSNVGGSRVYTGTYTPAANGYFVGGGGGTIEFSNTGAFAAGSDLTVGNGGGGTVIVSGDNAAFNGAVAINAGRLQIGNGGTTGSLGIPASVTNNGTIAFDRTDDLTFGGSIGGSGLLIKEGPNTLTLSGASTYSGGTRLLGGTLALGTTNALATTSNVTFGNNTANTGNLDLTTFDQTLGSLNVSSNNATDNVINIPTGQTLTVNGNVIIGNTATDLARTGLNTTGGGSLVVSGAAVNVEIGRNIGTTNNAGRSLVDFSSLGNFTASLGTGSLVIQPNGDNTGTEQSSLTLSNTANTITAATITVGGSNTGAQQLLKLGNGTNVLNADTINVGTGGRDGGLVDFVGVSGSLKIRGSGGTDADRAALNIGTGGAATGNPGTMTLNVAGHAADLKLSTVNIGTQPRSTNYTASLSFDQGTLDMESLTLATRGIGGSTTNGATAGRTTTGIVNIGGGTVSIANGVLNLGQVSSTSGNITGFTSTANGTINITGGTVTIGATAGTAINMGDAIAATAASGTLNFTGGTTTINGDIVHVGGAGTTSATFNLDGGTVDLTNKNIGSASSLVTMVTAAGTLSNVGSINGTAGLDKTTVGVLTLAGTNAYTGGTTVSGGTLIAASSSALGTGPVMVAGTGQILAIDGPSAVNVSGIGNLTIPTGNTLRLSEIGDQFTLSAGSVFSLDTITLDLNNAFNTPGTYTVIDGVAGANSLLGTTTFANVNPGLNYSFAISSDDAVLSITAIPEPSTIVLGTLFSLGLAAHHLRRRRLASTMLSH